MNDPAETTLPEEPKMEIHKPKPVHNWREFLKEYAIIVLGVATALAAEQAAEALHDRAKAAEARIHIRAEIANNLRLINTRAAVEDCTARRLDEVNGLIASYSAGTLEKAPLWIGHTPAYAMPDNRYRAAIQTGAVSLFDDAEQSALGVIYSFFGTYFQFEIKEGDAWATLRTLEEQPPPNPALDAKLREAIKEARENRWVIQRLKSQIMIFAKGINVAPDAQERPETQSACFPLHTPRAEAVKQIIAGRWDKGSNYDEP